MPPKKLGATGRVTPKVLKQQHDPSKDHPIDGTATAGAQGVRTFGRPTARKRDRRNRLLNKAVERHGIPGVGLLLETLEAECGDLAIGRRLERLIDAEPAALALLVYLRTFNRTVAAPLRDSDSELAALWYAAARPDWSVERLQKAAREAIKKGRPS
jgi:hypothetical protein